MASSAQCTSSNTSTDAAGPAASPASRAWKISSRLEPRSRRRQERAAELPGDVEQRSERPRGEQPVAGAPGPRGPGLAPLALLDQRGLADPGLTGDEHQAALAAAGLGGVLVEGRELWLSFEEHRSILVPASRIAP